MCNIYTRSLRLGYHNSTLQKRKLVLTRTLKPHYRNATSHARQVPHRPSPNKTSLMNFISHPITATSPSLFARRSSTSRRKWSSQFAARTVSASCCSRTATPFNLTAGPGSCRTASLLSAVRLVLSGRARMRRRVVRRRAKCGPWGHLVEGGDAVGGWSGGWTSEDWCGGIEKLGSWSVVAVVSTGDESSEW
jgi:hypothetical protein